MSNPTAFTPHRVDIRFADIDAMGHVNNAVYFSYFEQARIHFFREMIGREWDWDEHGMIVARNEVDYLRPVYFRDNLFIHIGCSHLGNKSFTLTYTVIRPRPEGEEVVASGASVLVCFNHRDGQTRPIPESWRSALTGLLSAAQ
jgi:acyl-CoA thioester hydrolase